MTVIYEQKSEPQNTPLSQPIAQLFWNTRGRAVEVFDKRKLPQLINEGFVRCESGVKKGMYNPVYDRGDKIDLPKISFSPPTPITRSTLEVIEV